MCVRVLPAYVSPCMCCLGTWRRYSSHHVCADHFQKGLESLTAKRWRQEGREAGAGGGLQAPVCGCVSCVSVWAAARVRPVHSGGTAAPKCQLCTPQLRLPTQTSVCSTYAQEPEEAGAGQWNLRPAFPLWLCDFRALQCF